MTTPERTSAALDRILASKAAVTVPMGVTVGTLIETTRRLGLDTDPECQERLDRVLSALGVDRQQSGALLTLEHARMSGLGLKDAVAGIALLGPEAHPALHHLAADLAEWGLELFERTADDPTDRRPHAAVAAARAFADGEIDTRELRRAHKAAAKARTIASAGFSACFPGHLAVSASVPNAYEAAWTTIGTATLYTLGLKEAVVWDLIERYDGSNR